LKAGLNVTVGGKVRNQEHIQTEGLGREPL